LEEVSFGHITIDDGLSADKEDKGVAHHLYEGHGGVVDSPPFHDTERGEADFMGELVEVFMFFNFLGERFDLADPRDVVVEE